MIKREIQYFFSALMFYTRIPCPKWTGHNEEYLQKSRKYFPLIGWIVGGISALIFMTAFHVFPPSIAVLLSIIAGIWVTGAFHEDGFCDVCDSFGGGWTKEQILTIMKDSRVGAFGAIGILLIITLKFLSLVELAKITPELVAVSMINAHTSSRFIASTFVQSHEYVQDIDKSKSKPISNKRFSYREMSYSFFFAFLPLFLFENKLFLIAFPMAYASKIYLGYFFNKHIGGYTGDCLGATQQVSEAVFYLSVLGIWKFM
jgi:adenosylcobinamide-GDP ribazoletransferase